MPPATDTVIFIFICAFSTNSIVSDDSKDQILCRKDANGLELIPNIFYCNSTQYCCNLDGAYACCSKEISPEDVKDQVILWCCVVGAVVVFALAVGCYFQDRYCCDKSRKNFDGEQETYRVCFCCKKKVDYRTKPKFSEPKIGKRNILAR